MMGRLVKVHGVPNAFLVINHPYSGNYHKNYGSLLTVSDDPVSARHLVT